MQPAGHTYWALARLWKMRGVKFVYDQHDLNPELYLSRFGRPRSVKVRVLLGGLRWLERRTYAAADHVISTNDFYREIAIRRGGRAMEDTTVVRSGPDTRRMRPVVPPRTIRGTRLFHQRARGEMLQRTVVVGRANSAADLVLRIRQHPETTGLDVVGVCLSEMDSTWVSLGSLERVPVMGSWEDAIKAVDELDADVVAVCSHPDVSEHQPLRRPGWMLEQRGIDLLVSPGIVEVAGPRLSLRPAQGLSLRPAQGLSMLHVERLQTEGLVYRAKTIVDRIMGAAVLALLAPVLVVLVIRLESKGPALFKQVRIIDGGRPFRMFKFRSMVDDAESMLPELAAQHDGNEVLFKMREDPRVTRFGRILRKYSLDELPQLLNVVRGEMSLVGPRPSLGAEVDGYEFDALRRLRVRPGMTGLWQVSGRSDLSWEDSLRLDLWYVDNWSWALDAQIPVRTARAVLHGRGAY